MQSRLSSEANKSLVLTVGEDPDSLLHLCDHAKEGNSDPIYHQTRFRTHLLPMTRHPRTGHLLAALLALSDTHCADSRGMRPLPFVYFLLHLVITSFRKELDNSAEIYMTQLSLPPLPCRLWEGFRAIILVG